MRVSSVNCYSVLNKNVVKNRECKPKEISAKISPDIPVEDVVTFKGQTGSLLGILAGGATAVGLAIVAAPVLICAGPILGAAGMYVGDKAEEKISNAINNKK